MIGALFKKRSSTKKDPMYLAKLTSNWNRTILSTIFFGTAFILLINLISVGLINHFTGMDQFKVNTLSDYSPQVQFFVIVIFAPFVETFVFQFLIIRIITLLNFKGVNYTALLISALAFGSNHMYNLYYAGLALLVGLFFAYIFLIGWKRFNAGFVIVLIIHAASNAVGYFFG